VAPADEDFDRLYQAERDALFRLALPDGMKLVAGGGGLHPGHPRHGHPRGHVHLRRGAQPVRAAMTGAASSGRQISRSGRYGSAWL
jgi:hypothetical protein